MVRFDTMATSITRALIILVLGWYICIANAFDYSVPKPLISRYHHHHQNRRTQIIFQPATSHIFAAFPHQRPSFEHRNISIDDFLLDNNDDNESRRYPNFSSILTSDRNMISGFGSLVFALIVMMNTATAGVAFAEDLPTSNTVDTVTVPRTSIVSCGSSNNCVSTASIKQADLFMLPWTWSESITSNEVISRLKGVIASDKTLSVITTDSGYGSENNNYYYFRIRAARNVCNDEIELLINTKDRIITFRSQQVDGPDGLSDFGSNRRRLEDIRKKLKVVTILGSTDANEDYYKNGESTEGITGQLKAFWGFQSGGGFESLLLDDEEQ